MLMSIISWIVFGFVVGVLARFLLPGPHPMGFLMTTALGVAGSFVGGWLGHLIRGGEMDIAQTANWLGSVIGSILLLLAYGLFKNKTV